MNPGDRLRLSAAGLKQWPAGREWRAVVVRLSSRDLVTVRRDGHKQTEQYHRKFWETAHD